ncbi:MAG: hypothetical protein IPI78_18845 [Chitinophagaceae bacterium]|nr:hypothetical protein [Chitinophagaceae bacterium]
MMNGDGTAFSLGNLVSTGHIKLPGCSPQQRRQCAGQSKHNASLSDQG